MTTETEFSAPATETSFAKESNSLEALIRKIEEIFDCRDGPYQAWVEHDSTKHYYHSLGILCQSTGDEYLTVAPEKLRNALLHTLLEIRSTLPPDTKPLLFWRYAPEQRIQEESEPLRGRGRRTLSKIFTRVAIPGADWSKVDCARYPQSQEPYPRIK